MDSIVDSARRTVAETGDGQGDGSQELAEVRGLASKLTPDRLEAFLDELGAELDSYLVDQIKKTRRPTPAAEACGTP